MLRLRSSLSGSPSGPLKFLLLQNQPLLLYPSADAVVILNAHNLALIRVLAFWQAFPGLAHTSDKISCISVDAGMKLIVAAMGSKIASWALSGIKSDTWLVHSSLALDRKVTTMDTYSGLLAIGTERGLSVYTLILENDLPTWSQKWTVSLKYSPRLVRFAPSLMYIATTTDIDFSVRLYSTTSGRQTQLIPHPRPVVNLSWRIALSSNRDDLILYTITADSVVRIFFPVLDSPQHLQLHASIDLLSSISYPVSEQKESTVFWMDREVVDQSLQKLLSRKVVEDDASYRRLQDIKEEGWDLFLRVVDDGTIIVSAVANIDRRPPTLLRQFTFQQFSSPALTSPPTHLYLVHNPSESTINLITSSPLRSFQLSLGAFLDGQPDSIKPIAQAPDKFPTEEFEIDHFVRTPEGNGVGVIRKGRGGEIWQLEHKSSKLVFSGSWNGADQLLVLDHGRLFASYNNSNSTLTVHTSPSPLSLELPAVTSLFTVPSSDEHNAIMGITSEFYIVHIRLIPNNSSESTSNPEPTLSLSLHYHDRLPVPSPTMVIPVDPMAWGVKHPWVKHDALLSVSEEGELAFWVPEEAKTKAAVTIQQRINGIDNDSQKKSERGWICTGRVRTGRTGIVKVRCSSAKKTALVRPVSEGEELTIWDSKESEFASGLEYDMIFSDSINDLDWTSTPDMQSILAVGFLHHVELVCQRRMTYFDEGFGWTRCWRIDIGSFIPYPISDSIWLANSSLLVGAGNQMRLYGPPLVGAGNQMRLYGPPDKSRASSKDEESLFEFVARQNGPLEDYHPQILLQCLLWDKVELVKEIIVNLAKDLQAQKAPLSRVPVERFYRSEQTLSTVSHKKRYMMLFDGPSGLNDDEEDGFGRPLVNKLLDHLEAEHLPHLTPNEQAHLSVLIQTTLEVDEQQRSLDANGLRYLISMRSFYILNRRVSSPSSPTSHSSNSIPQKTSRRERLRYRDMIWAFHSESQDLLLNASSAACNGKMCWADARALGVPIWLSSIETLRSQFETVARNEYMANDTRDPTNCSLLYFALGKTKLVHGLWRQASWHKEQNVMLKFLSNDFSQPRWRTAALKNAFALLSKQRFEYAAAFFLLGNSLKDAVNVCLKQLGDFQLAVAIARIVEQSNEGPILQCILNDTVLPVAFKEGNRWLASWAFWLLHRRDLSVRVLVTPLQDLTRTLDKEVFEIGESHYDDPSLALLFWQLRGKTLQAAKGSYEISGRLEFNFVLQIARVFCRMGCHVLALDLVRSWTFERPAPIVNGGSSDKNDIGPPPSPSTSRHSLFSDQARHLLRRSSMMIDMDISSYPTTRATSPVPEGQDSNIKNPEPTQEEPDLMARKAGLGNLMKSARQDVKVPDFDINAFF
ncbi:regulator of (H+)-ATPase in vacuolar membrane [Stygiomarasmius scandens]|uniref:Regulator of (H+)-ATPase in vacuolar membrane n=1 Tax=Marasmiellus scandens TaxID=2682957 RepID=A0ABR1JY15_9AGAR